MRKIIVFSMITLDGVIQSPGGPEEDTDNGFSRGGWVAPYTDDVYNNEVAEELRPADYLLGRKTYEIWAGYWPQHGEFWPHINSGTKYVLSRKLKQNDSLIKDWQHSVVIRNADDIKRLKEQETSETIKPEIHVWGSSELIHLLLENDLVDELHLKIHPLILGKGKKLFIDASVPTAYKLMKSITTPSGVIIAQYNREGEVKTGNVII